MPNLYEVVHTSISNHVMSSLKFMTEDTDWSKIRKMYNLPYGENFSSILKQLNEHLLQ